MVSIVVLVVLNSSIYYLIIHFKQINAENLVFIIKLL